eukprot:UN12333
MEVAYRNDWFVISTTTFPLLSTPILLALYCSTNCLKLVYYLTCDSPLPRIVFYLESRKSDPREEIMER